MKTIENLIFKGGGVLGTAYVGAFNALQESMLAGKQGSLPLGNVKRVAGTSAGSIFSAMISMGLSAEQVATEQANMNYATFVDIDPNAIAHEGLCYGNKFLEWMKALVKRSLNVAPSAPDPTFADLWKLSSADSQYKDLHVYSYCADSAKLYEFSYQTTPDVPIAEAVRASMSIPFFFQPWKFSGDLAQKYPGKFVDGGVMYNYPVSTFDNDGVNLRTLGFYLDNMSYGKETTLSLLLHWLLYATNCSETVKTIAEGALNTMYDLERINQSSSQSTQKLLSSINEDQGNSMSASDTMSKLLDSRLSLDQKTQLVIDNTKSTCDLSGFFSLLKDYGQIIAASIHLPTNLQFSQDAQRTVFINYLGYNFADFWMPQSNQLKLIDSGYNCTKQYLQYMMY